MPTKKKCLICKHEPSCERKDKQDDSKFNSCGITFIDTKWEVPRKRDRRIDDAGPRDEDSLFGD